MNNNKKAYNKPKVEIHGNLKKITTSKWWPQKLMLAKPDAY